MEGKRFGVGLVAGLLLGLVIVTASSGFTFGLNGNPLSSPYGGSGSDLKSAQTSTTTTPGQSVSPPAQNSTVASVSGAGHTTTSTTSGSSPATYDKSANSAPGFSSHVGSIAQQPVLTNAIIFLPVLFAFLLGAVLYRASTRREGNAPEEAK
jgi:hypothetical protein